MVDQVSHDTTAIEALEAEDVLRLLQGLPQGCRIIQVDTNASNPESVKQGYLFELPVQKWSRTERAFKNRVLALTKSSVVEMDVVTR